MREFCAEARDVSLRSLALGTLPDDASKVAQYQAEVSTYTMFIGDDESLGSLEEAVVKEYAGWIADQEKENARR